MQPATYWARNPKLGKGYFYNPGDATDTTDNAIAGPIPIGFDFFFNGIRYDSFYVSTNGVVALTNRRYTYKPNTDTVYIREGARHCYDPMSMDWFTRTNRRLNDTVIFHTPPQLNDTLRACTFDTITIKDDWGWRESVLGGDPANRTGGIRGPGTGGLSAAIPAAKRSALIAPFWGDNQMSQYNPHTFGSDDWSKVWYRRNESEDQLIIWFINIMPIGVKALKQGDSYTAGKDLRAGKNTPINDVNYCAATAQVILNKVDSSIAIQYGAFDGNVIGNNRTDNEPQLVFRYNTTCGVRGFARHMEYPNVPTDVTNVYYPWPSTGEYEQFTHYFSTFKKESQSMPYVGQVVKFKQWKNVLRVVDIQYRVRQNSGTNLAFSKPVTTSDAANNYEVYAGHYRFGAIQPIAILQNLTNNIQGQNGVNYTPQQLKFRALFRIVNEATTRSCYIDYMNVDSLCLALPQGTLNPACSGGDANRYVRYVSVAKNGSNYNATEQAFPGVDRMNGIPPYGFVQVYFQPWTPNPLSAFNIGRMKASVIADPRNPATDELLGEEWPFDDTTSVTFFVMKNIDRDTIAFYDDVTDWHVINGAQMPSTLKWVNINGEVVSGDVVSKNPLSPRGNWPAANNSDYKFSSPDFASQYRVRSPSIKLNRWTLDQKALEPVIRDGTANVKFGGDELRSFPINMTHTPERNTKGATISFAVQRNLKQDDWPRDWCDQQLVGPEPRAIKNLSPYDQWTDYAQAVSRCPDEIALEFAFPDTVNMTNIPEANWRVLLNRYGASQTGRGVYTLYGGGGYQLGYSELNKDSALTGPQGVRFNVLDDGVDWEFHRISVKIPDTFLLSPNGDYGHNFRFRIAVRARNHQMDFSSDQVNPSRKTDDDDPFVVDNIRIMLPMNIPDLECFAVNAVWPYSAVPLSQTVAIPLIVRVANNSDIPAPRFKVRTEIFYYGQENNPQYAIYCREQTLPGLGASSSLLVEMPNWDASGFGEGEYIIKGSIKMLDIRPYDKYSVDTILYRNDTSMSSFTLKIDTVMAYDPQGSQNDVPMGRFTGTFGRGLNLLAYQWGGAGSYSAINTNANALHDEIICGAGDNVMTASGQIAMRFTLYQPDTIRGYQVWFGSLNTQSSEQVQINVYQSAGLIPGTIIAEHAITRYRGWDYYSNRPEFNKYITYLADRPIALAAGTYWISISQNGYSGLNLGATRARSGMRTTVVYTDPQTTVYGEAGINLCLDKNFRFYDQDGYTTNNNCFAAENYMFSGSWMQFFPTTGTPCYSHNNHFGQNENTETQLGWAAKTGTLSTGSWVPLFRPYFGKKKFIANTDYSPCDSPNPPVPPVELTYFDGQVRRSGIELFWETKSEVNNQGFLIERKVASDENGWINIGFVQGAGNTSSVTNYTFVDSDLKLNETYNYRLYQVDFDGTRDCGSTEIVTLKYDKAPTVILGQNSPNPCSYFTNISFNLPEKQQVSLDILDIYGNVVVTLVNDVLDAKENVYVWNCCNEAGQVVANGTYLYRLTTNGQILTGKISVVR